MPDVANDAPMYHTHRNYKWVFNESAAVSDYTICL